MGAWAPGQGWGCIRINSLPLGTRWALEGGSPTPGPDRSFPEGVGSQGASPPPSRRGCPGCGGPRPLPSTAATVPGTAGAAAAARFGSVSPLPSGDVSHKHPVTPLGSLPAPLCMLSGGLGSGPSNGGTAVLGLLLRFSFGESAPLFLSLSLILCLLSQVSLLQAWEGSGDASFCSNTRTIWP